MATEEKTGATRGVPFWVLNREEKKTWRKFWKFMAGFGGDIPPPPGPRPRLTLKREIFLVCGWVPAKLLESLKCRGFFWRENLNKN